jgi:hypothetical protein
MATKKPRLVLAADNTSAAPAMPDFSGVQTAPNTGALEMLPTLVQTLRDKIRRAEQAAQDAQEAANDLLDFQTRVIPEAMELAGVGEFTLSDGSKIKVKDDLKVSITEANRFGAHEWLREHGHGGVIKTFLEVDVRTLDEDDRMRLKGVLASEDFDVPVIDKENIHPSTLKSLVKELLESGTTLPSDFSIHQFKKAELKEPKAK